MASLQAEPHVGTELKSSEVATLGKLEVLEGAASSILLRTWLGGQATNHSTARGYREHFSIRQMLC